MPKVDYAKRGSIAESSLPPHLRNKMINTSNAGVPIIFPNPLPTGTINGTILRWNDATLAWEVTENLTVYESIVAKVDSIYFNDSTNAMSLLSLTGSASTDEWTFIIRNGEFEVSKDSFGNVRIISSIFAGAGYKMLGVTNTGVFELVDYPSQMPIPTLPESILVSNGTTFIEKLFDGTGVRLLEVLADGTIQPLVKTASSIPIVATGFTKYLNASVDDLQKIGTALDNIPIYTNPNKKDIRTSDLAWSVSGWREPLTLSVVTGTYEIEFMIYMERTTYIDTSIDIGLNCSDTGVTNIKGIIDSMDTATANSWITNFNGNLVSQLTYNWGGGSNVNVKAKAVVTFANACDLTIHINKTGIDSVACKIGSWLKAVKLG